MGAERSKLMQNSDFGIRSYLIVSLKVPVVWEPCGLS